MSLTVTNLQTNLAYRLGESSAPSDATVSAQRLEWLNMGYFAAARRRNWWWLEGSDTSNTNTGSTTGYDEPSDLKDWIELKIIDIYYDQIPYKDNRIYQGVSAVVQLPTVSTDYKFYTFGGKYHLMPTDGNDSETHYVKYWKRVTKKTSGSDTFLMPDEYLEGVVAFAEFRHWMSITQQVKAQTPLQEYEAIMREMEMEDDRRKWGWSRQGIKDPNEAY